MPKTLHKVANGKLWMSALYLITYWWLAEVLITPPSSYHVVVLRFPDIITRTGSLCWAIFQFIWVLLDFFFLFVYWFVFVFCMTLVLFSSLLVTQNCWCIFSELSERKREKNKNKLKFHLSFLMPANLDLLRVKSTQTSSDLVIHLFQGL